MKSFVDLSTFDNSDYKPGSKIKIVIWFIIGRIFINTYLPIPIFFKVFILRLFGAKIGKKLIIKPKVLIKYPWFLEVGNNVWIGEKAWIDNLAKVIIEDNVCISQGALLLTGNHDYKKVTFDLMAKPIHLEPGVWIGANSVVCPGVTCHLNSMLTVGSIATKDLEENGIFQGNPALFLRKR